MKKIHLPLLFALIVSQFQCKSARRGNNSQLMDEVSPSPADNYVDAANKAIAGSFSDVSAFFDSADPVLVNLGFSFFNFREIDVDFSAADLEAAARKTLAKKNASTVEAMIEAVGLQCSPKSCPVASFGNDIVAGAQGVASAELIDWLRYRLSRQPVAYTGQDDLQGTTSTPQNEYEKRYLISSLILATGRDTQQVSFDWVEAAVPIAQRLLADAVASVDAGAPIDPGFLIVSQAATNLFSKIDLQAKAGKGLAVPSDFLQLTEAYRRFWAFIDKVGGDAQRNELKTGLQSGCSAAALPEACAGLDATMGSYFLKQFVSGSGQIDGSGLEAISNARPPEAIALLWPETLRKIFCPNVVPPSSDKNPLTDACVSEYKASDRAGNVTMALLMSRDSIAISGGRFKTGGSDFDLASTLPSSLQIIQFFDALQATANFGSANRMSGMDPIMVHAPVVGETYKTVFGPFLSSVARTGLPASPDSFQILYFFNGLELSRLSVDPRLTLDGVSLVDKIRAITPETLALSKLDFSLLKSKASPLSLHLCSLVSADAAEVSPEIVARASMYARILFSFPYAVGFGSRVAGYVDTDFSKEAYSAKASQIGNFRAFKAELCKEIDAGSLIVTDLFSGDGVTKKVSPYLSGVCSFTQNAPFGDECRMLLGNAQDIVARKYMYVRKF